MLQSQNQFAEFRNLRNSVRREMLLFRNGHNVLNPHTSNLLAHHQVAVLKIGDTIAHTVYY